MYFPIIKNRTEEMKVIEALNSYFEKIVPIVEVIEDEYFPKYKVDLQTGNFVYEIKPGNTKKSKIPLPRTDEDIVTLSSIQNRLNGKEAFIDFFRFQQNEYEKVDYSKVQLSFNLSRNFISYKERLTSVGEFKNLHPIISIKEGFEMSKYDLIELINSLKEKNAKIAIRIVDQLFENYESIFTSKLTNEDYLMMDLRDQNPDSKFIEIDEFINFKTWANKVILNCPRRNNYRNGEYENLSYSLKINNTLSNNYQNYGFVGFGDFGGLKDDLPKQIGGGGKGAALALIYNREKNSFFSIVNVDTSKGLRGYEYVRDEILKRADYFDPDNQCLALQRIKSMQGTFGNWSTWNNLILTRYIQQQSMR